jgi:predicted protein tyrosine phosphatase
LLTAEQTGPEIRSPTLQRFFSIFPGISADSSGMISRVDLPR